MLVSLLSGPLLNNLAILQNFALRHRRNEKTSNGRKFTIAQPMRLQLLHWYRLYDSTNPKVHVFIFRLVWNASWKCYFLKNNWERPTQDEENEILEFPNTTLQLSDTILQPAHASEAVGYECIQSTYLFISKSGEYGILPYNIQRLSIRQIMRI